MGIHRGRCRTNHGFLMGFLLRHWKTLVQIDCWFSAFFWLIYLGIVITHSKETNQPSSFWWDGIGASLMADLFLYNHRISNGLWYSGTGTTFVDRHIRNCGSERLKVAKWVWLMKGSRYQEIIQWRNVHCYKIIQKFIQIDHVPSSVTDLPSQNELPPLCIQRELRPGESIGTQEENLWRPEFGFWSDGWMDSSASPKIVNQKLEASKDAWILSGVHGGDFCAGRPNSSFSALKILISENLKGV